jgi:hypothetical protein
MPLLRKSASTSSAGRQVALGLPDADGHVTKPYSKNILADTIRRVLKTAPAK